MILGVGITETEARGGHNPPGRARGARRGVVGCAHLVRRLVLYFGRKEAYIQKYHVKIPAQSELWISGNIRNGFRPDLGSANRREQRGRTNLGGAPPPPPPWRPWTRGGTLLPSSGEAKEEEEGGGSLSHSLPVPPECRRGKDHDRDLHQQSFYRQHQLSPPLCSDVAPLLSVVISTLTWCSTLHIISQCMWLSYDV